MKIFIKTLNGTCFAIYVRPADKVADVKINIETVRGSDVYPAAQLMLIHQGTVLKDNTSLEQNSVAENSYVVVMLTKSKVASNGTSSSSSAPSPAPTYREQATFLTPPPIVAPYAYGQDTSYLGPGYDFEASIQQILDLGGGCWNREIVIRALRATYNNKERAIEFLYSGISEQAPILPVFDRLAGGQARNPLDIFLQGFSDMRSNAGVGPLDFLRNSPPEQATFLTPPPIVAPYAYGQDTSYLGPGYNFEASIQQILDLGGGCWNREIVIRALRATYNNKERAIEFLYSGISEQALILPVFDRLAGDQGFPDMRSNAGVGPLDFLRNSPQFRAMRAVVQANPQTLQPMLRELGMQNPHLMQRIQQHYADFLRLEERNVTVTLEEREVIERLEAMGFDRAIVLEVFFACNKNEELAANYLLDHMHEFEN